MNRAESDSAGFSDDEDGGDEQDRSTFDASTSNGWTSDGSSSDGPASNGPESVHSSGSDNAHSVSEGQGINSDGEVVEEGDCPTSDADIQIQTVKWFGQSLLGEPGV